MTDLVEIIADLRLVLHWESKRMGAVSAGLLKSTIEALDAQPSMAELEKALNRCLETQGYDFAGPWSEAKTELRRLRNLRTTWFDKENETRRMIDNYLDNHAPI